MDPGMYRALQNRITRPVLAQALSVLGIAAGGPISDDQWARVVQLLFPGVQRARSLGEELAREFYAAQNPAGTVPDWTPLDYTPAMLAKGLERARPLIEDPIRGKVDGIARGAAVVGRHVDQAGRDLVVGASGMDPADVKWARTDPSPPSCAFCQLLISRGPAYWSETTGGFQAHDHDTCVAVPVFDVNDWPGRDQFRKIEKKYQEVTGDVFGSDKLRAFRRAVHEEQVS